MAVAPWLLALHLLCGADAASTQIILARDGREAWLPTQNPYVVDGLIAAQAVGTDRALRRVARDGHPRVALGVAVGLVALRGFVVAHNVQEMKR